MLWDINKLLGGSHNKKIIHDFLCNPDKTERY